ncbi:MAG: hypothetical protein AAFO07_00760, partial [Bacteroidota bacterium]
MNSGLTYTGVNELTNTGDPTGSGVIEGYFRMNLWDKESTKLPYAVGSYLGNKKVLGIGAGFFSHMDGMYNTNTEDHESVFHFAFDAFMDLPTNGGGLTAYVSYMNFNYGNNYVARWAGTGSVIYGHAGYFIKSAKIMPYVAFQRANYEGFSQNPSAFDVGINYHILGHNAKITLEYHTISNDPRESTRQIRLQGHIFL